MYQFWKKRTQEEMKSIIFSALEKNVNFSEHNILGIPASYLDDKVFYQDASFLKDAPFITTMVHNPNHIGCHTLGKSERFFQGTQQIERDLIELCAVDILKGKPGAQDGYVASGGTEANMQAIWIYRNFFQREYQIRPDEIAILCSEDSHYSMPKAANVLAIQLFKVAVDKSTRQISRDSIRTAVVEARAKGKRYFIVVCNMMTTMFGSVDDASMYAEELQAADCLFKIHVDGAFGGFYYPFADASSSLTFQNPYISSFTLDAHKMAQAPYGTGIFLIRKGLIHHANTQEASYVEGQDFTLIGSRSGANAVAVWMILMKIGPFGWQEKIYILQKRTEWLCDRLQELGIDFYRNKNSNIVTMHAANVPAEVAYKFGLVPDSHTYPQWYKVVVMDHVTLEKLTPLVTALGGS